MDYEPVMKKLLKLVVRSFYEPHHVVIMDILLENMLLSDTDFCSRMKMLNREFSKMIIKLKEDGLIKSDIKMEANEDNRHILKNVYFLGYAEARDAIKYKIFKMTRALDVKKTSEDEAFYCDTCEKYFSTLDAQALVEDYQFKCIFCRNELKECTHKSNQSHLGLRELLLALDNIISLLREAETHKIPSLDYFHVLALKREREKNSNTKPVNEQEERRLHLPETAEDENSTDSDEPTATSIQTESGRCETEVNEIVTVNGVEKAICDITEDDKGLMNEDEYIKYFEIYSRHNS